MHAASEVASQLICLHNDVAGATSVERQIKTKHVRLSGRRVEKGKNALTISMMKGTLVEMLKSLGSTLTYGVDTELGALALQFENSLAYKERKKRKDVSSQTINNKVSPEKARLVSNQIKIPLQRLGGCAMRLHASAPSERHDQKT